MTKLFTNTILILAFLVSGCSLQQKKQVLTHNNDKKGLHSEVEYPNSFTYTGNPLSRIHGAADPDVKVWDGKVWVYCSQDRTVYPDVHEHHYNAMDGYHVFSSEDMVNWTDHGEVFHSRDVDWGWEKGGFMWAPGAARKNGMYYLYFPHKDKDGKWRVGVATGKTPIGPFKDSGKPIEGLDNIDPMVFIDDDGEAYLYNNPGIVAKLKPNMIELAEEPRTIEYGPENVKNSKILSFNEGAYMHKKDGLYYFSYTNWKNKDTQGFYATGKSPYGPFEWQGSMGPNPKGAQDHHSIIEFKDQWYYFYHIAYSEYPAYKESQGRIACFDKLFYNNDGTIQMVKHTLSK
ncbi:MAG: family 43 glycosylhydrolase [Planctomycetes bacterium]|nr:family 43 glycosylhydrolase [Planctomycetota bacterium]